MKRKEIIYKGLQNIPVYVEDVSLTSPDYFQITEFPLQFTAGKNAFKFKGNPAVFRYGSDLQIEIIDFNGEPIYYEVVDTIPEDGAVIIAVYVYKETPSGTCTVTLLAEAADVPDEWQGIPNTRWSREVTVNAMSANVTEIVFDELPTVNITEQIGVHLDRVYANGQFPTYSTGNVQYTSYQEQPAIQLSGGKFTKDMVGGTITVSSPQNPTPTPDYTLSTTAYTTTIKKILSDSLALLNTEYQVLHSASMTIHTYKNFDASSYSVSYEATPTYVATQNSESYAVIEIQGLQPATGDVARIKTYMNNNGTVGTWELINDVELLETDIFVSSTASLYPDQNIGAFTSQSVIDTYWEAYTYIGKSVATAPTLTWTTSSLNNAMRVSGSTDISASDAVYVAQIKPAYAATFVAGAEYKVTIDAIGTSTNSVLPKLSVYLSGSAFDFETTDTFNQQLPRILGRRVGEIELTSNNQRLDDYVFNFEADRSGTATLLLVIENGTWQFSDVRTTTDNDSGYTPNYTRIRSLIPTAHKSGNQLSFKTEYYNVAGERSKQISYVYDKSWTGGNRYIDGDYSMITGSLYVADTLGSGIAITGQRNTGYVRSLGYAGFDAGNPGFLIWSGSALPGATSKGAAYSGVGIELYANTDSYLRYSTSDSELDVRTNKFFFGSSNQYISGANGNIEISSSNFRLDRNGNVSLSGSITAYAGNIGGFTVTTSSLAGSNFYISGSATGNQFFISASKFNVKANGDVTASSALFSGSVSITGDVNASTGTIGSILLNGSAGSINSGDAFIDTFNGTVLDTGLWYNNSNAAGEKAVIVNGALRLENDDANWDYALVGKKSFQRSNAPVFVWHFKVLESSATGVNPPRMMIGVTDITGSSSYTNNVHAIYFSADDIVTYEGATNRGTISSNTVAVGDTYRIELYPKSPASASYIIYKNENYSTPFLSASIGFRNNSSSLYPAIWTLPTSSTMEFYSVYAYDSTTPGAFDIKEGGSFGFINNSGSKMLFTQGGFALASPNVGINGNSLRLGDSFKFDGINLTISGSAVKLQAPTFLLGTAGSQFISGSNGKLQISSTNFSLDTSGSITATNATFQAANYADQFLYRIIEIYSSADPHLSTFVHSDGKTYMSLNLTGSDSAMFVKFAYPFSTSSRPLYPIGAINIHSSSSFLDSTYGTNIMLECDYQNTIYLAGQISSYPSNSYDSYIQCLTDDNYFLAFNNNSTTISGTTYSFVAPIPEFTTVNLQQSSKYWMITSVSNHKNTILQTANHTVQQAWITPAPNLGLPLNDAPLSVQNTGSTGTQEKIARFRVSDDTLSYMSIQNATTADNVFVPTLVGQNSSFSSSLLILGRGVIDTGTAPITIFDSRIGDDTTNSAAATRPLFTWRNNGTAYMTMNATGSVGIGITTPSAKLHVNNTTTLDSLLIEDSTNPDTTPFVIDNGGNVGVGTETPAGKLTVSSSGANGINLGIDLNAGASKQSARLFFSNDTAGQGVTIFNVSGSMRFQTGATVGSSTGTTRMTLSGSNLGIAKTNPSAELDVNGDAFVSGSLRVSGSITLTSGSVTMPHRPAFRIYGNTTNSWTTNTILSGSWVTVDYNQGNNYNNATGVFTAPVAGLYQVNLNCRTKTGALQQAIVYKNTSTAMIMWETTGSFDGHVGVGSILNLAVSDTLNVKVTAGTIQFDANDSWAVAYVG